MTSDIVKLSGPLTFATVAQHLGQLPQLQARDVDLGECPRIDSAGASFLLELARRSNKAQGQRLSVINANEQVKSLLRFLELDEVIAIA